jgi:ribonuclease HI
MEAILAPKFVEFGRSGRVWSKVSGVPMGSGPIAAALPLAEFAVRAVGEGVALVTYVSEVQTETRERANRSSLWVFDGARWRLTFHQATPLD